MQIVGLQPVVWRDGTVVLIDQRKLPTEETYFVCQTWEDVAFAIRDMVVRGAPAIGVAAAMGVALAGVNAARRSDGEHFYEDLRRATKGLLATRPTAYNLAWALKEMEAVWSRLEGSPQEVAEALVDRAQQILAEDVASCRAIGDYGADLILGWLTQESPASESGCMGPRQGYGAKTGRSPVVLTHCNAGALATGGYGTALGIIRSVYRRDPRIRVLADETRPLLQGARLTAWELSRDGIPVEVITDGMAGYFLARGEVTHVVVGADRIAANGDTANKIGTYALSVLARFHEIPFIVAAPFSTVDLSIADGRDIPIEERSGDEVAFLAGVRLVPEGVPTRNPAFDVTPAANISAIVTDRGVALPPFTESLIRLSVG